jgi:hypothetical protein
MDYVLIPGASGRAWYWHLVAPRLAGRGHRAIAVELPADDDTKGLSDYAEAVLDAAGPAREVVVVAASLGAFTAPLVVEPLDASAVVLVNPMIPRPGETPDGWWGSTGVVEAQRAHASRLGYPAEFDPRPTCSTTCRRTFSPPPPRRGSNHSGPSATPAPSPTGRPQRRSSQAATTASSRSSSSRNWPAHDSVSNRRHPWRAPGRAEQARRSHGRDPRRYRWSRIDPRSWFSDSVQHSHSDAANNPTRDPEPSRPPARSTAPQCAPITDRRSPMSVRHSAASDATDLMRWVTGSVRIVCAASVSEPASLLHLACNCPRVRHGTHVPELIGIDHRAGRLDPPAEHVERQCLTTLPSRSRRIAPGWPFTSRGSSLASIRASTGKFEASTRATLSAPITLLANAGALPPPSPTIWSRQQATPSARRRRHRGPRRKSAPPALRVPGGPPRTAGAQRPCGVAPGPRAGPVHAHAATILTS